MPLKRRPIAGLVAAALVAVLGFTAFACGSAGVSGTETGSAGTSTSGAGASTGATDPAQQATTTDGDGLEPAPAFSGITLDGQTVASDQYQGKPLFLAYMTSG